MIFFANLWLFCGAFVTLGLVHKGEHGFFTTKVYVGIKTLCIDKI